MFSFLNRLRQLRSALIPILIIPVLSWSANNAQAQAWTAKLDDTVRFYQTTDVGAIVVGTKKSL